MYKIIQRFLGSSGPVNDIYAYTCPFYVNLRDFQKRSFGLFICQSKI